MEAITRDALATITGGMKTDEFRRSTNIEDRRPPEAIHQDSAWMMGMQQRTFEAQNPWNPWPPAMQR